MLAKQVLSEFRKYNILIFYVYYIFEILITFIWFIEVAYDLSSGIISL